MIKKKGGDLGEPETHESYGMISASRISSNQSHALFGSSIKHANTIIIRINGANIRRNLNSDRYYAEQAIVQVEMSNTQFAEFITSMNMGDGIPCTIRYLRDKDGRMSRMEDPPYKSKIVEFQKEFREDMQELGDDASVGLEEIKDLLLAKDRLNKSDREQIYEYIHHMVQKIKSSIPFVSDQFNRQMSKTVAEARNEVEAYVMHNVIERGLASLQNEVLSLAESTEDSDSENQS